ncbi:MAG: hypothetical protein GXP29_12265 [Planctomycetes bacterium]|nr:hypothetical protein [Planctomycetota bacterium]
MSFRPAMGFDIHCGSNSADCTPVGRAKRAESIVHWAGGVMSQIKTRVLRFALLPIAVLVVLTSACLTRSPLSAARAVSAFRIENATASPVQITVEVLDANGNLLDVDGGFGAVSIPVVTVVPGSVSFSTLEPVGAAAAAASLAGAGTGDVEGEGSTLGAPLAIGTQATVRVPGFALSEGFLSCGESIRITGTIETSEAQILFEGDGTGTFGFDEGSVGESGERFLIRTVHFGCGDSIVIRVGDDGVGVGAESTQTPGGTLAVVGPGETSPFDPIVDPGAGEGGDGTEEPVSTDILVQIANDGDVIATAVVKLSTGVDDPEFTVTVPPGEQTEGVFACGTQYTISATYPNPETPEDQETTALVILTGDGTGSPGFDEVSVSRQGERILVVGTHVNCGDTILVTLDDASEPIGFQGIGVLSGTVEVIPGG